MNTISTLLNQNTTTQYITALGIFLIAIVILQIVRLFVVKKIQTFAQGTKTSADDFALELFSAILIPLLNFVALYGSLHILTLTTNIQNLINTIAILILTLFGIRAGSMIINYLLEDVVTKVSRHNRIHDRIKGIKPITTIIIWGVGIIFLLDNLGFEVSAVMAGLGIGGVAVAFAAQAVLGDMFSYLSIILDRPFDIGDFIIAGEKMGTVEHIGIKNTRLRSLSGEQLIFANTDLTSTRLHNYKRMPYRRVEFTIGVTYETSPELIRAIPDIIKNIIEAQDLCTFDWAYFYNYGPSSLDFEVVYHLDSGDYHTHRATQHMINTTILETFNEKGISFAYPTSTVYLPRK